MFKVITFRYNKKRKKIIKKNINLNSLCQFAKYHMPLASECDNDFEEEEPEVFENYFSGLNNSSKLVNLKSVYRVRYHNHKLIRAKNYLSYGFTKKQR